MMSFFARRLSTASILVLAACGSAAAADGPYPNRAIQLLVTVPPGGAADFIARLVGGKLSEALGQPIVVVNRGGAGGTLAANNLAKAEADGYTLLLNSITTHGIGPHLYVKLPYDPIKDFAPIGLVAKLPLIMAVAETVPAKSVAEFVALAKAQPGQLAFASAGKGGAPHLAGEMFKAATGTSLLHVPYKGSGPAVLDVAAGRVAVMFDAAPSLWPFISTGKMRVLAAASKQRNSLLPDVPTFAELGYKDMDIDLWFGLVAPGGTSAPILQRLNGELNKVLTNPALLDSFAKQGIGATPGTPEDFTGFMRDEMSRWALVVKAAGIEPD